MAEKLQCGSLDWIEPITRGPPYEGLALLVQADDSDLEGLPWHLCKTYVKWKWHNTQPIPMCRNVNSEAFSKIHVGREAQIHVRTCALYAIYKILTYEYQEMRDREMLYPSLLLRMYSTLWKSFLVTLVMQRDKVSDQWFPADSKETMLANPAHKSLAVNPISGHVMSTKLSDIHSMDRFEELLLATHHIWHSNICKFLMKYESR